MANPLMIKGIRESIGFIALFISLFFACPSLAAAGQFMVVRVYNGDTVMAQGHDIEIIVELVGIDAPEMAKRGKPAQPYGKEAKEYLAGMILNRTVDIKGYGVTWWSRVRGVLSLEGKNINLEMVKAGWAEVEREKLPEDFDTIPYLEAERKAKSTNFGMWVQGGEYISPRKWREMHQ